MRVGTVVTGLQAGSSAASAEEAPPRRGKAARAAEAEAAAAAAAAAAAPAPPPPPQRAPHMAEFPTLDAAVYGEGEGDEVHLTEPDYLYEALVQL